MFRRLRIWNRRARPAPLLNERGQGIVWLLAVLAVIFWIIGRAKGVA